MGNNIPDTPRKHCENINEFLFEILSSEKESRKNFGQIINVLGKNIKTVRREELFEQLDSWWATSLKQNGFVILGAEGFGKTWAVSHWLSTCFLNYENPPKIHFHSYLQAHSAIFETKISKLIEDCLLEKGDSSSKATSLIVIDGINESRHVKWRPLFNALVNSSENIAWIVTCRPSYWRDQSLDSLTQMKVFNLEPYNDKELEIALTNHLLSINDIPQALLKDKASLLRIPRYFDLTIRHRKNLSSATDLTIPRLIYEEFKDLLARKSGNITQYSDSDYKNYLRRLAREAKTTWSNQFKTEDSISLPRFTQETAMGIFEDLLDRGVCIEQGLYFSVDPERLILGHGLLLADEIFFRIGQGESAEEIIAAWMEPQPDIDLKMKIIEVAVYHSLIQEGFPLGGQLGLLEYWLFHRNWDTITIESFLSYFRVKPDLFRCFIEDQFKNNECDRNEKIKWLSNLTFTECVNDERYLNFLVDTFECWLSYFDLTSDEDLFGEKERKELLDHREMLRNDIGITTKPGVFKTGLFKIRLTNNSNLCKLSEVALEAISHTSRKPFMKALSTFSLVNQLYFFNEKWRDLSWILLLANENLDEDVVIAADALLSCKGEIAARAANSLLFSYGSIKCYQRIQNNHSNKLMTIYPEIMLEACKSSCLNADSFCYDCPDIPIENITLFKNSLRTDAFNPSFNICKRFRKTVDEKLSAIVLKDIVAAGGFQTLETFDYESIRPIAARYSKHLLIEYAKRIFNSFDQLTDKQAIFWLRELHLYFLIMKGYSTNDLIAMNEKISLKDGWKKKHEFYCLIELALFFSKNGNQQLDFLNNQTQSAFLPSTSECLVLPISDYNSIENILKNAKDTREITNTLLILKYSFGEIPMKILDLIFDLVFSGVDPIEQLSLDVIYQSSKESLFDRLVKSDWSAKKENNISFSGSMILIESTKPIKFKELIDRIKPRHYGLAVMRRGFIKEELQFFRDHILSIFNTGKRSETIIRKECILEVTKAYPEILDVFNEKICDFGFAITHDQSFRFFLEANFKSRPEKSIELYKKVKKLNLGSYKNENLNPKKTICTIKSKSKELLDLKLHVLTDARTDHDLLSRIVWLEKNEQSTWLIKNAEKMLRSNILHESATALVIFGFSNYEHSDKILLPFVSKEDSRLNIIAKWSLNWWRKNQLAHFWFKEFINSTAPEEAWCYFSLFSPLVDRRCFLWIKSHMNGIDYSSLKSRYVMFWHKRNSKQIIKKNEKDLKNSLYGISILKDRFENWNNGTSVIPS